MFAFEAINMWCWHHGTNKALRPTRVATPGRLHADLLDGVAGASTIISACADVTPATVATLWNREVDIPDCAFHRLVAPSNPVVTPLYLATTKGPLLGLIFTRCMSVAVSGVSYYYDDISIAHCQTECRELVVSVHSLRPTVIYVRDVDSSISISFRLPVSLCATVAPVDSCTKITCVDPEITTTIDGSPFARFWAEFLRDVFDALRHAENEEAGRVPDTLIEVESL